MLSRMYVKILIALLSMVLGHSFAPRHETVTRWKVFTGSSDSNITPFVSERFVHNQQTSKPWVALATALAASLPLQVLAVVDEAEVAELPPPYVPVIFAFAMIGGVGWLTSSLGNVMDEEASLGLQSGARAKKERERSSSSYFKKK
jgi:hypothetical protein